MEPVTEFARRLHSASVAEFRARGFDSVSIPFDPARDEGEMIGEWDELHASVREWYVSVARRLSPEADLVGGPPSV